MDNQTIGVRLYNLRVNADYTQEDLAFKLNVSRQSISKWELDKTLPDTQKLIDLASLYEVSLDYIILGVDRNVEESDSVNIETEKSNSKDSTDDVKDITEINVIEESNVSVANTSKKINSIKQYIRLVFTLISGLAFVFLLVFLLNVNSNLVVSSDKMNTKIVSIDNVYEQYTLAEVTSFEDDGNLQRKKIWLDTNNISEGDSIFAFTDEKHPNDMKFQYYKKTLLAPLVVMLLFFALFVYFIWDIYNDSKTV